MVDELVVAVGPLEVQYFELVDILQHHDVEVLQLLHLLDHLDAGSEPAKLLLALY